LDTVLLSERRTVTLLYNINQIDFVRMMQYVFCEGEAVFLKYYLHEIHISDD